MTLITLIVILPVMLFSIVFHEIAHGWMADKFGDDTAKAAGRLTLNPLAHLDPIGSLLVPGILMIIGAPVIGWAKPVPINPMRFNPERLGMFCVAIAGVAVNFFIAITLGLILRMMGPESVSVWHAIFSIILGSAVYMNLLLGVFNLIPLPPLDGYRILSLWLSWEMKMKLERLAPVSILLLVTFLPYLPIFKILGFLFRLITGINM